MTLQQASIRVGLGAIALVAAVLVQEFAVRLALPDYDPSMQVRFSAPTETLPSLGPPNTVMRQIKNSGDYNVLVKFNRYGFRDDKDVAAAQPEDILLVGDSFAFGWGVEPEDRVSERIEKATNRRVFNLATTGNVDDYEKTLSYAHRLGARARNLVVMVNLADDVRDYELDAISARQAADAPPVRRNVQLIHVKLTLLSNSALYFLATAVVNQTPWLRNVAERLGLAVPVTRVPEREVSDKAINSTVAALADMGQRYNAVFVVIPNRGIWLGSNSRREQDLHARFVNAMKNAQLKIVDMKHLQERGGSPLSYHFANDGHWLADGHALAAEALLRTWRLAD